MNYCPVKDMTNLKQSEFRLVIKVCISFGEKQYAKCASL